jgi:GT2 family glycosyltransferase
MKVSVIVTTYNWESALKSALRSIAQQTVLSHEVIVADDGSKDSMHWYTHRNYSLRQAACKRPLTKNAIHFMASML